MSMAPALQALPPLSGGMPAPRTVDYLRISITDRCNERCLYCLPEQFSGWTDRADILTFPEILSVVRASIPLGFRHFRVTGGEPLLRPGAVDFIADLIREPGVESVQLTTNGTRLPELAPALRKAGLEKINISLDAIDPEIYRDITRGDLKPVLEGIRLARTLGFPSIKLNTVLIRGRNEKQIWPLIHFAAEHDVPIRFIELMPVSLTEMLNESNFLPVGEVRAMLEETDTLEPLPGKRGHGPATYFRLRNAGAIIGFIGALTDLHFCENCNKIRLTSDGKIRPCLGNHGEFDLKPALRDAAPGTTITEILRASLEGKPPEHLFRDNWKPDRIMTAIGG